MKAERQEKAFVPVTITLETEQELIELFSLVNIPHITDSSVTADKLFDVLLPFAGDLSGKVKDVEWERQNSLLKKAFRRGI